MMPKALSTFSSRILSVVCVLALFGGGLWCSDRLLVNKASQEQYEQFFQSDQEFDVLFLGSSHVINGVSPLDLYREYGITSFNLSMHGNYVASGYYLLKESLEWRKKKGRQLPKAVVLDIYGGDEIVFDLHNAWDSFPLSPTKVEMVRSLVPREDQAAMLVPFILYHNRWNQLDSEDFRLYVSQKYGVQPRYEVCLPDGPVLPDAAEPEEINEQKQVYLGRIRQLCESQGIRLILIQIPYTYYPQWQREGNAVCRYARDQGMFCVNYLEQEIGLDYEIDFYDPGHLNAAGMRILTRELGRLLTQAGLEDHRGQEDASLWEEKYEEYIQYRIRQLGEVTDAKACLMGIQDPDLVSDVQIRRAALEDRQTAKLVRRLEEAGHTICLTDDPIEVAEPDGTVRDYDVYCQVYRRDSPGTPVHAAGFLFPDT